MDVFDFAKLIQTFLIQFLSAAGHFHAHKRTGEIIGEGIIDLDSAGLFFFIKTLDQPGVTGISEAPRPNGVSLASANASSKVFVIARLCTPVC